MVINERQRREKERGESGYEQPFPFNVRPAPFLVLPAGASYPYPQDALHIVLMRLLATVAAPLPQRTLDFDHCLLTCASCGFAAHEPAHPPRSLAQCRHLASTHATPQVRLPFAKGRHPK